MTLYMDAKSSVLSLIILDSNLYDLAYFKVLLEVGRIMLRCELRDMCKALAFQTELEKNTVLLHIRNLRFDCCPHWKGFF